MATEARSMPDPAALRRRGRLNPGDAVLYGLTLGILFFSFQAPDVALSNIVIGAVAMPTMILLAIAKTKK